MAVVEEDVQWNFSTLLQEITEQLQEEATKPNEAAQDEESPVIL